VLVCHCFRVTEAELRRVLDASGAGTVEAAAAATGATRGCGSCRPEVEALLGAVLRRRGVGEGQAGSVAAAGGGEEE
jgi:NAD(P)H-nitrite reductase large subunit